MKLIASDDIGIYEQWVTIVDYVSTHRRWMWIFVCMVSNIIDDKTHPRKKS